MSKEEGRIKHGAIVTNGKCYDCAQGIIGKVRAGFEYFDQDDDGRGFWFCRYCGSNQVTVVLASGTVVQDSIY